MTMFDRRPKLDANALWPLTIVAWLGLSAALMMISPTRLAACRRGVWAALYPGQKCVAGLLQWTATLRRSVDRHLVSTHPLERPHDELRRLRVENKRLREALAALPSLSGGSANEPLTAAATPPLLNVAPLEARVLGQQARSFLRRHGLLDAGAKDGLNKGDLVVEGGFRQIDLGKDLGVAAEDLLLAGRHVWGRLTNIGRCSSMAMRVDSPGFRALVRVAGDGTHRQDGPRGVLQGAGHGLCRIRFVPLTEPVSVGDRILAADTEGLIDVPLVYGQIIRIERPEGATHWNILMRAPAAERSPRRLTVLRARWNPQRQASL